MMYCRAGDGCVDIPMFRVIGLPEGAVNKW